MANKTRAEIASQIYSYLPQVNTTAKTTLVNNCIDLAVEDMSNRHDWRCLRATTPDTATLAAGAYYLDLSSFTVMGAAATYFKDILMMRWLKGTSSDYGEIKFRDDADFHQRWGYYDYTDRDRGEPCEYTRLGDRLIFNCPANESLTIRCFYQMMHPPFATDATPHSFSSKVNMLAFQTIVYGALTELKSSLTGVEFPQEIQTPASLYEGYLQKLIASDRDIANESIDLGWGERSGRFFDLSDPYGWARP